MNAATRPAFLITIDTEGDNLWSRPRQITARNAGYLPRFQQLCERFGFKPVYLTNYEMAVSPELRQFAHAALRRGTAEIGMHLHAWNSPPLVPLTDDDYHHQPYLMEYPEGLMAEKAAYMTRLLETEFGAAMRSHRAGRWGMSPAYARILAEQGYRVDCSVTPGVSWQESLGDPKGSGGPDYRAFPSGAYRMDLRDISRPGASPLWQLPMTIDSLGPAAAARVAGALSPRSWPRRALGRLFPPAVWLRPRGGNLGEMLRLLRRARSQRRPYVEFMLHSSEFMPGGSPTFATAEAIENLYRDLEKLFAAAAPFFRGATLGEYAATLPAKQKLEPDGQS